MKKILKQNKLFLILLSLTLVLLFMVLIPVIILYSDKDISNNNQKENKKEKEKENDKKVNKTLQYLFIDRYPFKLRYKEGEIFDETGLILRAYYDDESNPIIYNYKSEYITPINLYDRYVDFLYEGSICGIELNIVNDEDIEIKQNYSIQEYILELTMNCITRFEMEEADITEWKISNNENKDKDKIVINNYASKKKYLSGLDKEVMESKLNFTLRLLFDAEIEMSVAYAQKEEFKNYEYEISSIYQIIINDNLTIDINENDKYLHPRTNITKWQLIKYKSFVLSQGEYNVMLKLKRNTDIGTPNIDYIDFKAFDIHKEPIEDIPYNDFHTYSQYSYINDSEPKNIYKYAQGLYELTKPRGNLLDFSDSINITSESYIIEISEKSNFEKSQKIIDLKEKKYNIKNLKLGQKIFYRGSISLKDLSTAKIYELKVNNIPPRNIDVPGVKNFRDIGGYKTYLINNGIIKQDLYYRSGQLNDITNEGKEIITKNLGIKVEIDLREKLKNTGPYIDGVEYHPIPIDLGNQEERFEKLEEQYYKVFTLISNANNKPIILHCLAGADRTGIMSFALLTLLGCDYKDIIRDYLFTNFSDDGYRDPTEEFDVWWKKLEQYEGVNKAEKCKHWLMSKGIEESKLEHIREIFIENYK